ncbi:MAG: hypothetical protein EOP39_15745 [Rubrivivax sp.]|nr:MAG: hypothetical protein EOP39_15745 [Rubrivivax sp.]
MIEFNDRGVIRQACACWVSADPYALHVANDVAGNARRALYWRARSVVVHDRVLRLIDADPTWHGVAIDAALGKDHPPVHRTDAP